MLVLLVIGPCPARLFYALFFSEGLWFMFELRQIIIGLPLIFQSFPNSGGWKTGSCNKLHRTLFLGRALFQMKILFRLRVFLFRHARRLYSRSLKKEYLSDRLPLTGDSTADDISHLEKEDEAFDSYFAIKMDAFDRDFEEKCCNVLSILRIGLVDPAYADSLSDGEMRKAELLISAAQTRFQSL